MATCPHCKSDSSKCLDSRKSGTEQRRRRECLDCKKRYATYEISSQEYFKLRKKANAPDRKTARLQSLLADAIVLLGDPVP